MGIALYNKLPQNLKKLDTKHIFKNKVKKLTARNTKSTGKDTKPGPK
jgi:hypothetical protein